jgi:hypothetical protein
MGVHFVSGVGVTVVGTVDSGRRRKQMRAWPGVAAIYQYTGAIRERGVLPWVDLHWGMDLNGTNRLGTAGDLGQI